jgi:hypothetical protein
MVISLYKYIYKLEHQEYLIYNIYYDFINIFPF